MAITIGFLVFPGIQLLDLAGPYEIFSALPDCNVHLCWKNRNSLASSAGMQIVPTATLGDDLSFDVLCIPGGIGINPLIGDEAVIAWIRKHALTAKFTTSVCTGAFLLGAAGLLRGKRATTHWRYHDLLAEFGAIPVQERIVRDDNIITGGGVTAGIDFGLTLVTLLYGQTTSDEIQLALEYAPDPSFQSGTPTTASETVLQAVTSRTEALHAQRKSLVAQWVAGMAGEASC